MSQKTRRFLVVLAFVLVTVLAVRQTTRARDLKPVPPPAAPGTTPANPNEANDFTHAVTLPTDNKLQKKMEAAQELIQENIKDPKEESWGKAIQLLQSLLDIKEDVFIQVTRKDTAGKEASSYVSVRTEANRLLGTIPPQGKAFYELLSGGVARDLLAKAKEASDPQLLAEVAQRYLHTEAGAEATTLLGTYHLDRGRFVMAALCFERLVNRDGVDKLAPPTLLKAALAFRRVGDKANADLAWRQLRTKARDGVKLGEQTVPLDELEKALARYDVPARELLSPHDWSMFGGNATRTAQGNGGAPYMEKKWDQPLVREKDTANWLDTALRHQAQRSQPVLPAFFPVAATVRGMRPEDPKNPKSRLREVTLPLLVYRSYWGIHAVNLKNGKLEWESRSDVGLDRMARDASKLTTLNQWIGMYLQSNPYLLYENSTLGMLSTDQATVFAVEDLALPPHPNWLMQHQWQGGWGAGATPHFGALNEAVYCSKLQAFDLDTGKLKWELGGRGDGDKNPLNDSYFLGAPLPLGGKLYLLIEKNQELKLVCLDPPKEDKSPPNVLWTQTLGGTQVKMLQDVGRRVRSVSLAYGDGILVCPTNAGMIFGVDLLSRSLVWAHAYRDKTPPQQEEDHQMRLNRMRFGGMVPGAMTNLSSDWKASAPVVQDGRVVFAAPDGSSVHCLNLRDGSLLWKASRKDDLYLGGVYSGKVLLVGKNACRALNLNDGKEAWNRETGQPSGLGIASKNVYYLPLKYAAQGTNKEPEVCHIDIATGKIIADTKSRKGEVPGNLLFYEGDVISMTATEVAAYPQVKVKKDQMNELIAKNPTDPVGLTARGELNLDEGNLKEAIADLTLALANNPPAELVPRTRVKLYETLTAYLQDNFNEAEKYLDDYRKLCAVALTNDMSDDDKAKAREETQRRQANYLCLVAKGREKQGRLVEAYQAYVKFGELAGKQELVSVVDEPTVRTSPAVWMQGRIAAMVAGATPEQRQPLEELIEKQWQQVKGSDDLEKLRGFVAGFGSLFPVGRAARLQLAERLLDDESGGALLEAERHLLSLRGQQEQSRLAAQAVETLARLYTRRGLLEDAAECYRILGREFGTVEVRDGKTGRDYLDDMATDKRFLPYFDEPRTIQTGGKIDARTEYGTFLARNVYYYFEPPDDALPFFKRHRLALDPNRREFKLIDRATGEEVWSQGLLTTNINLTTFSAYSSSIRFPCQTTGHLAVVSLGPVVYGLDPVNRKLLWEKFLTSPAQAAGATQPAMQPGMGGVVIMQQAGQMVQGMPGGMTVADPRDGTLWHTYPDGWIQRLGQNGPVEASYVCLQTRDGLVAIDPATGRTLWTRSGVEARSHLFGDDEHIYLVEMDAANNVTKTLALRAHDGVEVKVPDFAGVYARRLRVHGRTLLLSENDPRGGLSLRLYEVPTGKDLWKKTFAANAVVLKTQDPELAGAVEPDGKVTVFDLRARKEVLQASVDPKDLEKVQGVYLLEDGLHFYVLFHGPNDPTANPWGGPYPNLQAGSGMRSLPVSGRVYAFQPGTGKVRWIDEVSHQMVVLDQLRDLPVLLFTARYQKPVGAGNNRFPQQGVAVRSVDKRTGKLLVNEPELVNGTQFYALNVDQRQGRIEFVAHNLKVVHVLPGGVMNATAMTTAPGASGSVGPGGFPQPAGGGLQPGGGARIRIVAPAQRGPALPAVVPAAPPPPPPPPAPPRVEKKPEEKKPDEKPAEKKP